MTLEVTNREWARQYRELRESLISGKVDLILVRQKDGSFLKISHEKMKTPFERMVESVKKNPVKGIERPEEDLFDYI